MKLYPIPLAVGLLLTASPATYALTQGSGEAGTDVTLRASVPMSSIVNTGDRMAFEYQTRDDAAVIVFNIDSRGYVHLLAPEGPVEMTRALSRYTIPEPGNDLVVDSQTGVEFVFAVAVTDPSAIDEAELAHLRAADTPGQEPYRISGDPFIAANMIAGELIRGVSRRGATFAYTMFYVNNRVDAPCYLCGGCDGEQTDSSCDGYRIVQDFDRRSPLAYPLRRGYQMVETVAGNDGGGGIFSNPDDSDVVVNFYPYGSQVRYIDPGYSYGLYDPYYWYWPYYYPYYPGWSISIGWGWGWNYGWGWGCGGGYYCSGWYAPCHYPSYGGGTYSPPRKFKSSYKSASNNLLASNRTYAAQRDRDLRIAQKDIRRSFPSRSKTASVAHGTRTTTRDVFASYRSRATAPHANTRVYGRPTRGKSMTRGTTSRRGYTTPRATTRTYTPRSRTTTRGRTGSGKSSWAPTYNYYSPRPGQSAYRGSRPGTTYRGGTAKTSRPSWGSSRGNSGNYRGYSGAYRGHSRSYRGGSVGRAPSMRGGGAKSAPHGSSRGRR